MSNEQKAEQPKIESRNWQDLSKDLGRHYRSIGIAAVAGAVEIFDAGEPKKTERKVAVRYLGNSAA